MIGIGQLLAVCGKGRQVVTMHFCTPKQVACNLETAGCGREVGCAGQFRLRSGSASAPDANVCAGGSYLPHYRHTERSQPKNYSQAEQCQLQLFATFTGRQLQAELHRLVSRLDSPVAGTEAEEPETGQRVFFVIDV